MIYFALCAAIACLAANSLRRMQLRSAGAGVIWGVSLIGGLIAGSALAIGLLAATGKTTSQAALPALFAQGFWWSLLGTAVGYYSSRIPTKTIAIAIALGCAALLVLGSLSSDQTDFRPPQAQVIEQNAAPVPAPVVTPTASQNDTFDPSRAVPLSTYMEMQKAGDDFNPARAVPLQN